MRGALLLAALAAAGLLASGGAASGEPSERKTELARELLALSGGQEAATQVTDLMLAQIHSVYPGLVEEVLRSETELDDAQKQQLRDQLQDFDRFATTFRERLPDRLRLGEVLESVYIPLYDARFSEAELEEIVAFYNTPTGRKVVAVLPTILEDGMRRTVPIVQPIVMELVGQILAEQRSKLAL